jgi:hypothetical protein
VVVTPGERRHRWVLPEREQALLAGGGAQHDRHAREQPEDDTALQGQRGTRPVTAAVRLADLRIDAHHQAEAKRQERPLPGIAEGSSGQLRHPHAAEHQGIDDANHHQPELSQHDGRRQARHLLHLAT